MIADGYEYICLGGLVHGRRTPEIMKNHIIKIIKDCLKDAHASNVKTHGFGIGTPNILMINPFYSADSTSFIQSKYGQIIMWDEHDMTTYKVKLNSPELVSFEHLFSRYGLPTSPYS